MLNTTTISRLREMKMSSMASAFQMQLNDPSFQTMSFEDRFGLIVDREWDARKTNQLNRLIKSATFSNPGASIENIDYLPDRNLDRELIAKLSTCNYITEHHHILLLGATGCGKTYMACALGMAAVRNFYRVKYVRLQDILFDLVAARQSNSYPKTLKQYEKPALLIIDEWMRYPLTDIESRCVQDIVDTRYHKGSMILCSQMDTPGWQGLVFDKLTADAICDRIEYDSYKIVFGGEESMRMRKSSIT